MTSSNGRAMTARTSIRKKFWLSEGVPGSAAVTCCGVGAIANAWAEPFGKGLPAKGSVPISPTPAGWATDSDVAAAAGIRAATAAVAAGIVGGVDGGIAADVGGGVGAGVGGGVVGGVGRGVGRGVGGGGVGVGVGDGRWRAATATAWLEAHAPPADIVALTAPQAATKSNAATSVRARWRRCMPSPCLLPEISCPEEYRLSQKKNRW